VLLSKPVCGETSRSARIFSARRTIGKAWEMGADEAAACGRPPVLAEGRRTRFS
jgi:hypothetical protein